MNTTTKFSVGDRAYYVIYANASINAVNITNVWVDSGVVFYNVVKANSDMGLNRVPETDLMTFTEARTNLLAYLNAKIVSITNMVAP